MTVVIERPGRAASTVDPGPFTCPVCRRVSQNPTDAWAGWCAACSAQTALPFDGPGPKLLVVGDAGGDLEWLTDQVIPYAQATHCTMIMQLGDFGLIWHEQTYSQQLDDLDSALKDAGLQLTFLPGNHEHHVLLKSVAEAAQQNGDGHYVLRPNVFYTGRVSAWTWGELRMAAVGGAPSIDRTMRIPGKSWWPEESLTPDEVNQATQLGPVDILFSHDGPAGVPLRLITDVFSSAHRAYMSQIANALVPSYWYHGHYHEQLFYRHYHSVGVTTVRGLGCNHATDLTEAVTVINLKSLGDGLSVARYYTPPEGMWTR